MGDFVDGIDQDQIAQKIQSDLASIPSVCLILAL